jgi:hypothetical protein
MILAQYADDLRDRPARHIEIRDQDLGSLAAHGKQRRISVRNRRHFIAGFRQNLRNEQPDTFGIVNKQDFCRKFRRKPGRAEFVSVQFLPATVSFGPLLLRLLRTERDSPVPSTTRVPSAKGPPGGELPPLRENYAATMNFR